MATLSYVNPDVAHGVSLGEVFTHGDARSTGISDRSLAALRESGQIERIARGIYARPGLVADLDLVEIAIRAPSAALCLTSALAHHDLIDDIPLIIDVALPRTHRHPRTQAPVRWHRFTPGTFDIGREALDVTDTLEIGVYSATRSIVDAYRLRHLYGTEQALDALKRWLQLPGSQPAELLTTAAHFPKTVGIIRTTLQTLL